MIKGDASRKAPEIPDCPRRARSKRQLQLRAGMDTKMTLPRPDAAFHWRHEPWGASLRCRGLDPHAQHLFTSKQLALPDPESWRHALASVGSTPARLMRVKQVHGRAVRVLKRGQISDAASGQRPDGDALVSDEPGLALAVMVADCVPILIVDPVGGAAAAVHAGWRGTCARVAPAAVETMAREFGTRPSDLIAAIGPSVGPDDYEVGESLVDAFAQAGHDEHDLDRWFVVPHDATSASREPRSIAKPHLDLWQANRDQLIAAGLGADRLYLCRLSTVSHPDVFESYRVMGERAGRMAGLVVVPGG
jgi:YfiH family protein